MKKNICFIFVLILISLFAGCSEEKIIKNPTVVIDKTLEESEQSDDASVTSKETNTNSQLQTEKEENSVSSSIGKSSEKSDSSVETVDMTDQFAVCGKWKILNETVDGKNTAPNHKYLTLTEDFKYYPANSTNSLTGNIHYHYENSEITVDYEDGTEEKWSVKMPDYENMIITNIKDNKTTVRTYEKIQ